MTREHEIGQNGGYETGASEDVDLFDLYADSGVFDEPDEAVEPCSTRLSRPTFTKLSLPDFRIPDVKIPRVNIPQVRIDFNRKYALAAGFSLFALVGGKNLVGDLKMYSAERSRRNAESELIAEQDSEATLQENTIVTPLFTDSADPLVVQMAPVGEAQAAPAPVEAQAPVEVEPEQPQVAPPRVVMFNSMDGESHESEEPAQKVPVEQPQTEQPQPEQPKSEAPVENEQTLPRINYDTPGPVKMTLVCADGRRIPFTMPDGEGNEQNVQYDHVLNPRDVPSELALDMSLRTYLQGNIPFETHHSEINDVGGYAEDFRYFPLWNGGPAVLLNCGIEKEKDGVIERYNITKAFKHPAKNEDGSPASYADMLAKAQEDMPHTIDEIGNTCYNFKGQETSEYLVWVLTRVERFDNGEVGYSGGDDPANSNSDALAEAKSNLARNPLKRTGLELWEKRQLQKMRRG